MLAEPGDQVAATEHQSCLRSPEELVAGAHDEIGAVREGLDHGGLVGRHPVARGEQSRADVVQQGDLVPTCEGREFLRRGRRREPHDSVVRRVHLEDRAYAVGHRGPVVADARPVGGADLDQSRPGGAHDVRDPELSADLDQLSSGDQHLLAFRQRGEAEEQRGGAVVDHEGVFCAGEGDQQLLGPGGALASATRTAIDLEVAVAPRRDGRSDRRGQASGARPRFVCRTTPVALITGVMPVAIRDARVDGGGHDVLRGRCRVARRRLVAGPLRVPRRACISGAVGRTRRRRVEPAGSAGANPPRARSDARRPCRGAYRLNDGQRCRCPRHGRPPTSTTWRRVTWPRSRTAR